MATQETTINDRREIFGWAMYDWANSAFSTTVVTVFFGPYLTNLAKEASAATGGFLYLAGLPIKFDSYFAYCVSISVLLQAGFLPVLGALADYSHLRKQLLMFFSTVGAITTILMFFIGPTGYWLGGALFILANLTFGASIVFYNSYLPSIASEDQRDRVSAHGFALGYIGGGILLLLNLVLYLFKGAIGIDSAMVARISLASAGIWWLGFSFITFNALHPRHAVRPLPKDQSYITIGYKQLSDLVQLPIGLTTCLMLLPLVGIPILILLHASTTVILLPVIGPIIVLIMFMTHKSKSMPEAVKYLASYLLYNDGIQTVIAVSTIFASQELNMSDTNRILVVLMIQFVAYGGAYGFAWIAQRTGTKNAIIISLIVWSFVTIYAWLGMKSMAIVFGMEQRQFEFWILAFVVALVLGGSQALSRSLFAQMIPKDQEAEFFSFYEISERGTSWSGPLIFGLVNQRYGSLRLGILSVIIFFIIGLILLPLVNVEKAKEQARQN